MKTKKTFLLVNAMLMLTMTLINANKCNAKSDHPPETYTVDATHSSALFKAKHFGISFVSGSFTDISGTIFLDRNNINKTSVEISIGTASVNTHLKERDDHLRNADFLDVEKYPTMTFKSSQITKKNDKLWEVTGSFTLHGVTKIITTPITFLGETDVPWGQHRAGFETSFSINRTDYGMDKLLEPVGDKIQITVLLEAMRIDKSQKKVDTGSYLHRDGHVINNNLIS